MIRFGGNGGGNCDLAIDDSCNNNNQSYSDLGNSYNFPNGFNTEKAKTYLAGSYKFIVSEIEVF